MMMRNGRISCEEALCESITKMFSDFNISTAGNFEGMFNGILHDFEVQR